VGFVRRDQRRVLALLDDVLVPSTMALMGRASWWLPSWLDRILPHVHIDIPSDEQPQEPAELFAA
jgi:putative drug exporter of the RND superfamily